MAVSTSIASKLIGLDRDALKFIDQGYSAVKKYAPSVFREITSERQYEEWTGFEGLGVAGVITEGGAPAYDEPIQWPSYRITPVRRGLYTSATADVLEDALTASGGSQLRQVLDGNMGLGRSLAETSEYIAWDQFNSGDSAYYVADGVDTTTFTFDNLHTLPGGATFDNLGTAASLDWPTLLAEIYAAQNVTDGRGFVQHFFEGPITVIVGRNQAGRLWELIQPGGKPDTDENTKNYLGTLNIKAMVVPYITGNARYLLDDDKHQFTRVIRKRPTFSRDDVFMTDGRRWKAVQREGFGNTNAGLGSYKNPGA